MKYSIHSRRTECSTYPIEWYITDEIGRWVHVEPFLTKEMAQEFFHSIKGFLSWVENSEADLLG